VEQKPFFCYNPTASSSNADEMAPKKVSPTKQPKSIDMTQECERCGKTVPLLDYVSHMDFHFAKDLQRELNGLPPLEFDLRPKPESPKKKWGAKRTLKGGKGRPSKTIKLNGNTRTLDSYFAPKE